MKNINKAIALLCVLGLLFTSVISINPIKASAADNTSIIYECENLATAVSPGDTESDIADTNCSNGKFNFAPLNAVGDYAEYTVNIATAGNYTVFVGSKNASNRGVYQLSIDGTNQGSAVDQYSAAMTYTEASLGDVTFSTTGGKKFRFTLTGKNSASNAYGLGFDYIKLVPVTNMATNIVANPGFEDTYASNGILLASGWSGWTATGWPPLKISLDSTNKHSGNYSVKISSDVNSRGGYIRNVPALPGKTYKFSIYVKTENIVKASSGEKGADVRIVMNTSDGSAAASPVFLAANTLTGNNDWTLLEKIITMPDNVASVNFQCFYGVAKGSAWFDDAKVVEYIPEIIANPGFEETYIKDGTLLASGWNSWTASGQLNFSLDSANKYSGNYSVKISSDVNSRGGYIRNISALPGKTYKFSIYVKTENMVKASSGEKGADVRICLNKSDGSSAVPPVFLAANTLTGNNDWTLLEKIITIPDNATIVNFQCFYGVATGSAWFDDAKAVEYTPVKGIELLSGFGFVKAGNNINVTAKVIPENANNKNVLWTSDNPSIATVNGGAVTGISEGTAIITAATEEGGFSQKFVVYVSNTDMEVLPTKTCSFSVDEDGTINGTLDKTDAKGNPLTYNVCEYAANGLARVDSNGNYLYSPDKNFYGTDEFKAIAVNGVGGIGLYDITITVNVANDAPASGDIIVGVVQGTSVSSEVTAADIDKDSITYTISSSPSKGTVVLSPSGDFTYNANGDSVGEDNFTVTASDNKGGSSLYKVNVFIAPQGQKMIDTLKSVSASKAHPRINAGKQTFDNLKSMLQNNDENIARWFSNVKAVSDTILTQPTKEYQKPDGLSILEVSREVLKRARFLSMTYRMTGDSRYAERLWTELDKAGNFIDWNPTNFLDTAEMTNAFGIAYDWLYDYWSPERKSFMVNAIKEKGLIPGINAYNTEEWWTKRESNWNGVCNGGLAVGALAVGDETDIDPEIEGIAAAILENAVKYLPYMLQAYKPDGAWIEGPVYWDYGTSYAVYMLSSMFQALGTDYGLSDLPCMDITTDFPIYNNGSKGSYNFADASNGIIGSATMLWFGTRYNNPAYYWAYKTSGGTGDPMTVLWYPGYEKYNAYAPPEILDKKFGKAEVGTMRSNWYDSNGAFLGFKGGYNQFPHGDLDEGSFVYDAYGVRWAMDFGGENYSSPGYWITGTSGGRWVYYRKRAEGHNTFVINPGNYPDQNIFAKSTIERFETNSNQTAAMSIIDLSETYNKDAFSAKRGLSLTNNKTDLLVQDEVRNRKPSDCWWFMHTDSNIEISSDGKSAILTNQGKRLYAQILSDEGKFSVMDAVPLPTSPAAVQSPNPGVRKLVVHIENALDVNLAVRMVPLMSMDEIPTDKPAVVSLDNWKVQEQNPLFLDGISVAGTPVQNFNKYDKNYRVILPYGTTSVPTVEAKVSSPDENVDVRLPEALPGLAKITVSSKTNPNIKNSYYIELMADKGITASVAQEGNGPENSMDGNLTTRWAAEGDQWIQYYIGEDKVVEGISIAYFRGNERKYLFDILVSEDGEHWETVLSGVQTSGTTSDLVRYDFPEMKRAKYVRIFSHGSNANRWNNIAEVSIHNIVDNAPPVTAAKVDGTEKNGWYSSDATVTLSVYDNLPGAERTVYRIGDSGDWLTYTGPIAVTREGTNTIQYRSTDKAGNVESIKQQTVQIDKTLPEFSLIVNGNILKEGDSFDDYLPLTFKVSDNLSGVSSAQISVSGSVYAVDLQTQPGIDIDLAGKVGSHMVTVIVEDIAGNRLEKTFQFKVTTSINSMRNLIDRYVKAGELDGAMVDQLTNNLDQAQHQLDIQRPDQAAKHMEDFIKHLNNEALKSHITEKVKEILNNAAKTLAKMWLGKDMGDNTTI